jgi:hypothetical protein
MPVVLPHSGRAQDQDGRVLAEEDESESEKKTTTVARCTCQRTTRSSTPTTRACRPRLARRRDHAGGTAGRCGRGDDILARSDGASSGPGLRPRRSSPLPLEGPGRSARGGDRAGSEQRLGPRAWPSVGAVPPDNPRTSWGRRLMCGRRRHWSPWVALMSLRLAKGGQQFGHRPTSWRSSPHETRPLEAPASVSTDIRRQAAAARRTVVGHSRPSRIARLSRVGSPAREAFPEPRGEASPTSGRPTGAARHQTRLGPPRTDGAPAMRQPP